jgi:hypothetical protein
VKLDQKSSKPVIILGSGGHAKVVADALLCFGREILGFITPDKPRDHPFFGSRILGDDEII